MKLHRALATAVVTTVIGPVALLATPAAYATGKAPASGATPSASAPATAAPTPAPTAAGGTDAGGSTAGGASGEPATGRPTAVSTPAASAKPTPATSGSAKPSATPSPTYTRPTFCSPIFDEERGKTGLVGLPGKVVAGSGWHEFTYRVTNVSKITVMETDISLSLGTADPRLSDVAELDVTVEWFSPKTREWKPVEGEGAKFQDNEDFATIKRLEPGEYADAKMRIKIGEKAKAGSGYFFTTGYSYGADDKCGFDDISQFDFSVLSPGSKPGKVDDAKGKPGKPEDGKGRPGKPGQLGTAGNKSAPHGGSGLDELPVSGKLAETGSSDTLPTLAAIGGAAALAGAGAVFLVRRRKTGSEA
ncbi:LAETG motif-containing sortase-dependent surface protein [Streptomyces halobius]|uniref:LPXTG cell wall anchor domain-containing protein n=1 Tax=Streptomyces halobius TaxID=2879846 RepID=A0ABY4M7Y1_9ACTN|nr:LAETG motif-containing sortase-dependent surface protein [Streptomyces halobius]UQA92515.1 LPXTG cell wall anchor domain-containing protein [Streptomyces halobius]